MQAQNKRIQLVAPVISELLLAEERVEKRERLREREWFLSDELVLH